MTFSIVARTGDANGVALASLVLRALPEADA